MRNQVLTAINAKAPIVGISLENDEPVAVEGKRLRAWAKGVTIRTVKVEYTDGEWYCEEIPPSGYLAEGPINLVLKRSNITRRLRITGTAGRSVVCPTRVTCLMVPLAREEAKSMLAKWSQKEAERISKRKVALSKEEKKKRQARYVGGRLRDGRCKVLN
jgi:hypothetical protein